MKNKDFKELLTSINQARKIHSGKMRKVKLTKQERWIEDHLEEYVPVSRKEFNEIKEALERRKKDKVADA